MNAFRYILWEMIYCPHLTIRLNFLARSHQCKDQFPRINSFLWSKLHFDFLSRCRNGVNVCCWDAFFVLLWSPKHERTKKRDYSVLKVHHETTATTKNRALKNRLWSLINPPPTKNKLQFHLRIISLYFINPNSFHGKWFRFDASKSLYKRKWNMTIRRPYFLSDPMLRMS